MVALFEHGEHGQYAAAIVRDVMKAYFDKKTGWMLDCSRTQTDQARWRRLWSLACSRVVRGRPGLAPNRDMTEIPFAPRYRLDAAADRAADLRGRSAADLQRHQRHGLHRAWWKQILYVAGGLLLMWLMVVIDYHSLLHYVPALYIGGRGWR